MTPLNEFALAKKLFFPRMFLQYSSAPEHKAPDVLDLGGVSHASSLQLEKGIKKLNKEAKENGGVSEERDSTDDIGGYRVLDWLGLIDCCALNTAINSTKTEE